MTIELTRIAGGPVTRPLSGDLALPRLAGKTVPAASTVRAHARFLTREQAAKRVGKSVSTIRAWEADGLANRGGMIREADLLHHDARMRSGEGRPRRGRPRKTAAPTDAERIADALGHIDQTTYANADNGPAVTWSNAEVLALLGTIAGALRPQEGAPE